MFPQTSPPCTLGARTPVPRVRLQLVGEPSFRRNPAYAAKLCRRASSSRVQLRARTGRSDQTHPFALDLGEFQEEFDQINGSYDEGKAKRRATNDWMKQLDGAAGAVDNMPTAFLVGIESKDPRERASNQGFGMDESLFELSQLAETAGLRVVGASYQRMERVNPKTYIGKGKVEEIARAVKDLGIDTVIFDDELSPTQGRNLEKLLGDIVNVCDRTNLILDIFSQRAQTKEGQLQVELAFAEYQLPRLTRMWSHLDRQGGAGQVKGMGEKQIDIDKRLLREKIRELRLELEAVRGHRSQYRTRRAAVPLPVCAIVGYTNAGKSTLINRLTEAEVMAEDKLFATLDPTTRRLALPTGKEVLISDTVGFIQKLPTQLVAAFRATLEEIAEATMLLHVVDVSSAMAVAEAEAVRQVLREMEVEHIPVITVWNKIDAASTPEILKQVAATRRDTFCISAQTGEGVPEFLQGIEELMQRMMVEVEVLIPYTEGWLLDEVHRRSCVSAEEFTDIGTRLRCVPP